jgi:S1-C subfamily serine protease
LINKILRTGVAVARVMPTSLAVAFASAFFAGCVFTAYASDLAFLMHQCRNSSALAKLEYCSTVISKSRDPRYLEHAFNIRGLAHVELHQFADAASDFTEVIKLNPTIAGYYDNRQNAYRGMGHLGDALKDADIAVRMAPTYSFVYRGRGNVYGDLGRYDLAISDFTTAINIDPSDVGIVVDRGNIFAKAGRWGDAVSDFTHAVDMDKGATGLTPAAIRGRGLAYKQMGILGAARSDLEAFVRIQPNDPEIVQALREIDLGPPAHSSPPPTPSPQIGKSEPAPRTPNNDKETSGTGFFVTAQGHVLTNAHVVDECSYVEVAGPNGLVQVRVIANDTANDLALLKSELAPSKFAQMRTGVRLGETVAAFGYPLLGMLSTTGNFTLGNVTSLTGLRDDTRYLQISTPVQPGNSGGPLLDASGNFVGVVSAKLNALRVMLATNGDIPQNVNFAVKSSVAATFLESNSVSYTVGSASTALAPADLADYAKAISVPVLCK